MEKETRNTHKGSARREHFERGGTPQMWRGSSRKFTDKKKEISKNACRNKEQE